MKILLTCGAGDFIALEGWLTARELASVTDIYWATRAQALVAPLVPFVFPNVQRQVTVWDQWGSAFKPGFCVETKADLVAYAVDPAVSAELADVVDYSVSVVFQQMLEGRAFVGSAFAKRVLADVSRFQLPEHYYVVHPYSENARTDQRDLTGPEWEVLLYSLKLHGLTAVVVNRGDERPPAHARLIDLTNDTSLLEALEITRGADGFVGASSVFSVLAAKVLPHWRLFVKGHDLLRQTFWHFYYAPLTTNRFLTADLMQAIPKWALP